MISIKNFWTCIIVQLFLFFPIYMYAESNNSVKKSRMSTPNYEIKSDIINFDYSNIGFPIKDSNLGLQNTKLSSDNLVPRELKRGNPAPEKTNGELLLSGIFTGINAVFITLIVVLLIIIIEIIVVYLISVNVD